jgi:hypothetical protein
MKKTIVILLFTALVFTLTGCGTTEATETAAPTTNTSSGGQQPSSTSYSLTVKVADGEGNPISWAKGDVQGVGSALTKTADNQGTFNWEDLTANSGTLTVSAQGYVPVQQALDLVEGSNEISVTMELDPVQLNPASVCKPGQTVLYVEDFEDSQAQDFVGATAPTWEIKSIADMGNVLEANIGGTGSKVDVRSSWDNAFMQFNMMAAGPISMEFYIHSTNVPEGKDAGIYRYVISYNSGEAFTLSFEIPTDSGILATGDNVAFDENVWHTLTFAFYKGEISVYLDGAEQLTYTDQVPVGDGQFGYFIKDGTSGAVDFDNIIVCSLDAAYTP